jgi:hypothetical protein
MTPAGAGFHRLRAATVAAMRIPLRFGWSLAVLALAGCAGDPSPVSAPRTPESIQAEIQSLIPTTVAQRAAWAVDLQLVFAALKIEPTRANVCAVLAVTEQESTYNPDPPVPNLAKVAREEILRRADRAGVPEVAVTLALQLRSRDGRSYDERLAAVRTERELSLMYEDFIAEVPLGRSLLAQHNPVRTAGPMQVSIDFAQAHVRTRPYPFPAEESLRHEVFTRRGGLYFGTAHLLDYPAAYGSEMLYRFADFNAGRWASRNAAFQQALATATGRKIDMDGDLYVAGSVEPGQTESATRSLAPALGLSNAEIRRELERSNGPDFDRSPLRAKVFALAEQRSGKPAPRAAIPRIVLQSPKITRRLTTEWFARRVDDRWKRCLQR